MNYFADLEDECHRGDILEKVNYLHTIDGAEIWIKDVDAPDSEYKLLGIAHTGVLQKNYEVSLGNLFCTYSFRLDKEELNKEFIIPEEYLKLGDHYLVIKDFEEFIKRVGQRVSALNFSARHGFVGYKDFSKFIGTKTVFCSFVQKIGVLVSRSSMNWKNWGWVLERFDFLNRKFGGFGYKFVSFVYIYNHDLTSMEKVKIRF